MGSEGSEGRLPNLMVAGVPKAGTGSLFAWLTQHPDICRGDAKEIGYLNYFNPERGQGEPPPIESYRRHFAGCGQERYALDATPTYSYGGRPVIEAMQKVLSSPKVIITLRNPVDRLWSAYTFQRTLGNIPELPTFESYLTACEERLRAGVRLLPRDHLHGLSIGRYADFIGEWLEAFGDDLKVVFADDMRTDVARVLTGVFGWLDIDTEVVGRMDLALRNTTRHARSPRVARAVFSAKRAVDRLGRVHPVARGPLRKVYERLNAGSAPERLGPAERARVEDLYRESNAETARLLEAHGYGQLPGWLPGTPQRA